MTTKYKTAALILVMASLVGCQSKQAKTQDDLKKLEAEYAPLQAQYNKDCLSGSPEHIAANRSICEDERKKTADLDQRIAVLRQQAMQ
jgi:valyl-tRNA synthetase